MCDNYVKSDITVTFNAVHVQELEYYVEGYDC